jgi:hypothetical protein
LLDILDGMHLTANVGSFFYWNGSRADVDAHLSNIVGGDGRGMTDDLGLSAHELEEQIVAAKNAR